MSVMPIVHLQDLDLRQKVFAAWEKRRNRKQVHWFMECFAEALGVFFYVYAGVASQSNWVMANILDSPAGTASVLQIGFAYCFGILFAIAVCSGTSGGHFNPAVTICFIIFKGFPKMKAVRYIFAQILGSFIACMLVYAQHKMSIDRAMAVLVKQGTLTELLFTPDGPAGAYGVYLPIGQKLGLTFLNEFVADVFIALVIWATFDPTNVLIPPAFGPVLVSLAYGNAIWGFGGAGLAANTARDLGGRLMAMLIWGRGAVGGPYSAVSALTSIPATILAALIYEIFLTDSDRVIPLASLEHMHIKFNHRRERQEQRDSRNLNNNVDLEQQRGISSRPSRDIELEDKSVTGTFIDEKFQVHGLMI